MPAKRFVSVRVVGSEAYAPVTERPGNRIEGASVSISADARTEAKIKTFNKVLALAYGQSDPTAGVTIESGATITASGDVQLSAYAAGQLDVTAQRSLLPIPSDQEHTAHLSLAAG